MFLATLANRDDQVSCSRASAQHGCSWEQTLTPCLAEDRISGGRLLWLLLEMLRMASFWCETLDWSSASSRQHRVCTSLCTCVSVLQQVDGWSWSYWLMQKEIEVAGWAIFIPCECECVSVISTVPFWGIVLWNACCTSAGAGERPARPRCAGLPERQELLSCSEEEVSSLTYSWIPNYPH